MKLELHNIGKIRNANISIEGITVIAGENDTGKSTVGKTLYSIFNSFYSLEKQISGTRCDMIESIMEESLGRAGFFSRGLDDFIDEIVTVFGNCNGEIEKYLRENINSHIESYNPKNVEDETIGAETLKHIIEQIRYILKIDKGDIFKRVLQRRIDGEFKKQIATLDKNEESRICLQIKDDNIEIKLSAKEITSISKYISLQTQAIYIDDPLIMDRIADYSPRALREIMRYGKFISHRTHLEKCLIDAAGQDEVEQVIEELIVDKRVEEIESRIKNACSGYFKDNKYYYDGSGNSILDVHNVSSGIKIFMVIKQLLKNKKLEENGTLILDEPEVYLHPKWQLLFAEIIVLLQKTYNMHILLATHSPYFLRAIEVYAAKHEIAEKCNFYLAEKKDDYACLQNVTNNTEAIYRKLLEPFESLQMEIYAE